MRCDMPQWLHVNTNTMNKTNFGIYYHRLYIVVACYIIKLNDIQNIYFLRSFNKCLNKHLFKNRIQIKHNQMSLVLFNQKLWSYL